MKNYTYILLITMSLACSCKKTKKGSSNIIAPQKTTLVSPAKDEACLDGSSISTNESKVTFVWNIAENANSYELVIKNLLTNSTTNKTTTATSLEVSLSKNTPYSWYVISKSAEADKTSQSEIWKFYNSGSGMASYAPFPAEIVSPIMGQHYPIAKNTLSLQWKGNDIDNDIASYDVYISTNTTLTLYKQGITSTSVENVLVEPHTRYYWKITTKDLKGNTSDSEIYQFWTE